MGVSGNPLPTVIAVSQVHSLKSVPFQPLKSVFPPMPIPVAYCICRVRRWRWSNVESPRSARRFSQFCAMLRPLDPALGVDSPDSDGPKLKGLDGVFCVAAEAPWPPKAESSSMDFEYVY